MPLSRLTALSPLDGRYADKTEPLAAYFSEWALMRYRVAVEVEYLIALLEQLGHRAASYATTLESMRDLYRRFSPADAEAVKGIERTTRHDMKAVEYWIKQQLASLPALAGDTELVHMGLTSDDVNNLAYALMHRGALDGVMLPALGNTLRDLSRLARAHGEAPMLARTHGQPASPTTMGKELGVFAARLAREAEGLAGMVLPGKLGGATGTLAALHVAYPHRDWLGFSRAFMTRLGLRPSPVTTQIEPGDGYAALYDQLRRINQVFLDLSQDMWRYISDGYFRQLVVSGEIGSSAMPHKVNPIDFENAEGNVGLANALLVHLAEKLTVSRLQRDLSGSTVIRNAGVAFGHTLMAWQSAARGMERIDLDRGRLLDELAAHPEVLAEAIQSVLRAQGGAVPYERLAELTRGKTVTLEALRETARTLAPVRYDLWRTLEPATYIGFAPQLANEAATLAEDAIARIEARTHVPDPFGYQGKNPRDHA